MKWLNNLISGLGAILQKRRTDRELDEELDSFLRASAAHKQQAGLTPEEALRRARVEMGSRNAVKHQVWSSRWESTLEGVLRDLRLSLRMLAKSPGFTAVSLLSLALGIGGNTAIFTLVHQVLLQDLAVRAPHELVSFGKAQGGGVLGGVDIGAFSVFPWYFAHELQSNPGPFQGIAYYGSFTDKAVIQLPNRNGSPDSNASTLLVPTTLVSGNYFDVLGSQPLLGRTLTVADDVTPGSGAVAVVSHRFWQQSLSSDPAALGKTIGINGTPFQVIGVMPEGFHGIKQDILPPELWVPFSMQPAVMRQPSMLTPTGPSFLNLFGRLSSKAALGPSQAWLDQQIRAGIRAHEGASVTPERAREISRTSVVLISAATGISTMRSRYGDSLWILMGMVVLVLMIACANLANFLLGRSAMRQREIATRLALGSNRARIARQTLLEALLLSLGGGALGLVVAFAATRILIAFVSKGSANVTISASPDPTVLLFTLGTCFMTALLFGLAPSVVAARSGGAENLGAGSRTAVGSAGKAARFWPRALVASQVMLSLLLLIGAGLFLRTLRNLQNQDYGFERSHLLLANFDARLVGYKPAQVPGLHQQLLERVSALPGVTSAALALTPPINAGGWSSSLKVAGYTPAPKENAQSMLNRVSGRYFETSGISIVAGRSIEDGDTLTRQKVAVINQTFAKKYFPGRNPLGRELTIDSDSVKGPWQIVGVARDTRAGDPRDTEPAHMVYLPLAQIEPFEPADPSDPPSAPLENQSRFAGVILLRTTGDPTRTIADLRRAVASVDPNLPLTDVKTITEQVNDYLGRDQLLGSLTGAFALLALLLAAIGLYGVMSYNVVRRTGEIGVRLALGAQRATVRWGVLRESLALLAIGTALGVPLSLAAAQLIRRQLYGLGAVDPAAFSLAIVVVSLTTLIAAWLPARRATRVDPMVALRGN